MTKGEAIKLLHAERCNVAEISAFLRVRPAVVRHFIARGFRWPTDAAEHRRRKAALLTRKVAVVAW